MSRIVCLRDSCAVFLGRMADVTYLMTGLRSILVQARHSGHCCTEVCIRCVCVRACMYACTHACKQCLRSNQSPRINTLCCWGSCFNTKSVKPGPGICI